MTAPLRSWARALGGDVSGRSVVCPGPGHTPRDRSLSVMVSVAAPDGFIVHSFAGDDIRACKDHVRARLGLPEFRPQDQRRAAARTATNIHKQPTCVEKQLNEELQHDTDHLASALWRAAGDPRGTLVEQYLKSRALELPGAAANETIRFHPKCRFGSQSFPAMVCLVRAICTNAPQGIHRTALAADGNAIKRAGKTFRLSLGKMSGGAIKLDQDEAVEQGLCIGEGVETVLAARQIGYCPAWAVGLGGIASFALLAGIDGLILLGERDEKGQSENAIRMCAARWLTAGREVVTAWPMAGCDLNDEIRTA